MTSFDKKLLISVNSPLACESSAAMFFCLFDEKIVIPERCYFYTVFTKK